MRRGENQQSTRLGAIYGTHPITYFEVYDTQNLVVCSAEFILFCARFEVRTQDGGGVLTHHRNSWDLRHAHVSEQAKLSERPILF